MCCILEEISIRIEIVDGYIVMFIIPVHFFYYFFSFSFSFFFQFLGVIVILVLLNVSFCDSDLFTQMIMFMKIESVVNLSKK